MRAPCFRFCDAEDARSTRCPSISSALLRMRTHEFIYGRASCKCLSCPRRSLLKEALRAIAFIKVISFVRLAAFQYSQRVVRCTRCYVSTSYTRGSGMESDLTTRVIYHSVFDTFPFTLSRTVAIILFSYVFPSSYFHAESRKCIIFFRWLIQTYME